MTRYVTLILLLASSASSSVSHAAQFCRSESEIPASTPDEQFVDHGNGTVTDEKTGLMWVKCSEGQSGSDCTTGGATTHNWQVALNLANSSNLGGYADWRLPNVNELRSIVEVQCYSPTINLSVFPNTPESSFWSASPNAYDSNGAWYVIFKSDFNGNGGVFPGPRSGYLHVRLVRGGQ